LEQIRYACHGLTKLQNIIAMLVLPKVLWGAAWEEPLAGKLPKLHSVIEWSVCRVPGKTGVALVAPHVGNFAGCGLLSFLLGPVRAIGVVKRRQTRVLRGCSLVEIKGSGHPIQRVTRDWGWHTRVMMSMRLMRVRWTYWPTARQPLTVLSNVLGLIGCASKSQESGGDPAMRRILLGARPCSKGISHGTSNSQKSSPSGMSVGHQCLSGLQALPL
jgi:hypothetical protein